MPDTIKKLRKGNRRTEVRLPPILQDYLGDLVSEGTYGDTKSEVVRRFVDEGIRRSLNDGRITKRDPANYPARGKEEMS